MKIELSHKRKNYIADLSKPIDISIPLKEQENGVNCFYAPPFKTDPVVAGDFIGSTAKGGPLNFLNVHFNPHGNGTHTECVGHIAREPYTINQCLKTFHFIAKLVDIKPELLSNGDHLITKKQIEAVFEKNEAEAIIIRTIPNEDNKLNQNYSGTNPPYLEEEATQYLVQSGVQHMLIDTPSVDREEDDGKLLSHHAFWQYPKNTRKSCTITEMIYAPNEVKAGIYLLNIQIASFEIDASPSKIVLYEIT